MARKKVNKEISTVIDGLHLIISTNNIHIEDSYTITNPVDMRNILNDTIEFLNANHITIDTPFNHRSICSMIYEWKTHNNLYKLNIEPDRTKSTDLDYPQKWYMKIFYFLCGLIIV